MHENRETSEMPEAILCDRPAGEGSSRTARVYVFEESDSGTVSMNHSNKSGRPPAESEEGRPLIKENSHQSSTANVASPLATTSVWCSINSTPTHSLSDSLRAISRAFPRRSASPWPSDRTFF